MVSGGKHSTKRTGFIILKTAVLQVYIIRRKWPQNLTVSHTNWRRHVNVCRLHKLGMHQISFFSNQSRVGFGRICIFKSGQGTARTGFCWNYIDVLTKQH